MNDNSLVINTHDLTKTFKGVNALHLDEPAASLDPMGRHDGK